MLLLRVMDDRGAAAQHLAVSFPYRIGRALAADLRLEAAGIWESHATILLDDSGKFVVRAEAGSLLLVNGQSTASAPLRAGDELTLGAARILVNLAPARQTGLRFAEALLWLLLAGVVIAEIGVIILAG